MRGMKQKAVDAVTTEPFLHIIGEVARRADQRTLPPSCGEALVDLSDRQPFLPRPAENVAGIAEAAECELPFGYVGERAIEMIFRKNEPAELGRIEVTFRFAVSDKRIVVPAVPQSLHNLDKLDRPVVAGIVLIVPLASEVEGLRDVR